jgi:DNA-binding NarL/FixJ family response regulator
LDLEGGGCLEISRVRVLVVDDFEPFRRFICSTLGKNPELQIAAEASDGIEAIHKAEALQPDLIVLDVGLPKLNGIEAARQIRKLSPNSKILFLTQESSTEVAREAFDLGALGYVVKAHAGTELLLAVTAVLGGRQFIGRGLSDHLATASDSRTIDRLSRDETPPSLVPGKSKISPRHEVEFYSDDAAFVNGFAHFIEAALKAGNSVIAVVTGLHRASLLQRLQEREIDVRASIERGSYVCVDVEEMLAAFMRNDLPDPTRFFEVAGELITTGARATVGTESRVSVCGECAPILWAQGKTDAAFQVEQLCNQLTKRYDIDILCGFTWNSFHREEDKQMFQKICSG